MKNSFRTSRNDSASLISKAAVQKTVSKKALCIAITLCGAGILEVHSAPTGGVILDGAGNITQTNTLTRIQQNSEKLSLQWDTFDVERNERVTFAQPSSDAIALNRILDTNGSQILGRIEANGQVVLVNPNGIFFGRNATVNVGGLVASGLDVQANTLADEHLSFSDAQGTQGVVVNEGLINAASGGNVALIGKRVINDGFINANLGRVALVGANNVVVSFDEDGLLGVKVTERTSLLELGHDSAVVNSGNIQATGGTVLLNASVSADLFSDAVNYGKLNGELSVQLQSDGGFLLGAGNTVTNTGIVDVSAYNSGENAGSVLVAGEIIENLGVLSANAYGNHAAGNVLIEGSGYVSLEGQIEAESSNYSGKVRVRAPVFVSDSASSILTSGDTYLDISDAAILPNIQTHHLNLLTSGGISQSGAIHSTGVTQLETLGYGTFDLQKATNDFHRLNILGASTYTYFDIADANDIHLNTLKVSGGEVNIVALGENASIRQTNNGRIFLEDGLICLDADNVILGGNGARTRVSQGGGLTIDFTQEVDLKNSVTIFNDSHSSATPAFVRVRGKDDEQYSEGIFLDVEATSQVNVKATYDEYEHLQIGNIVGDSAFFGGQNLHVSQTGAIQLTGGLLWKGFVAELDHSDNDIHYLNSIAGLAFGIFHYVDKNDLLIEDVLMGHESSVRLTSLGVGSTITQAETTQFIASNIGIKADNIHIGGNGTSQLLAEYSLSFDVGQDLLINGEWGVSSQATYFSITGSDRANRVEFGAYSSSINLDNMWGSFLIDLKGGNDTLIFNAPIVISEQAYMDASVDLGSGNDKVYIRENIDLPIYLGAGRDSVYVWNPSVNHELLDIDYMEDRLIYGAWRQR